MARRSYLAADTQGPEPIRRLRTNGLPVALLVLSGSYLLLRLLTAFGVQISSVASLVPLALFAAAALVAVMVAAWWALEVFRARRDAKVLGTPPPRHVLPPLAVIVLVLVVGTIAVMTSVYLTAPILEWWYERADLTVAEYEHLVDVWIQAGLIALSSLVPIALACTAYQWWRRSSSADRQRRDRLDRRGHREGD